MKEFCKLKMRLITFNDSSIADFPFQFVTIEIKMHFHKWNLIIRNLLMCQKTSLSLRVFLHGTSIGGHICENRLKNNQHIKEDESTQLPYFTF